MVSPYITIPFNSRCDLLCKTLDKLQKLSNVKPGNIALINDFGSAAFNKTKMLKGINKRIKYIKNTKNIGCNKSIYKAVNKYCKKYFIPLGNGDFLLPNAFQNICYQIKKNPKCNLFLWPLIETTEDGNYGSLINRVNTFAHERVVSPNEFRKQFYGKPFIGQGCYRVSIWKELGGFRSELEWHADHFLCHILGNIDSIYLFHKPMGTFFRDPKSYGSRSQGPEQEELCLRTIWWLDKPANHQLRSYLIQSGAFCVFQHVITNVLRNHPSRSIYLDAKMRLWLLRKKIRGIFRHPIPKRVKEYFRDWRSYQ